MERYKYLYSSSNWPSKINRTLYTEDRFFDFRDTDTNILPEIHYAADIYQEMRQKFNEVKFIGDKCPSLFAEYSRLQDLFSGARFLFMLRNIRDVASSWNVRAYNPKTTWPEKNDYRAAVMTWNRSLTCTAEFLAQNPNSVFIVNYEKMFSHDSDYLLRLCDWLQIPIERGMNDHYDEMTSFWKKRAQKALHIVDGQNEYIESKANLDLYGKLIDTSE